MAREPPPKRLDQCANCCVPVGVRITDDNGKVDMSKSSSNCQAKVSAFIINADGRQNTIRVTDALKEVYKLNLLSLHNNNNNNNNNNVSGRETSELFLCYSCSLIFPKLYKLFHDFYSLRKVDSILAKQLIEIDDLIAQLRASTELETSFVDEHRGNISVRSDIFEPESVFKDSFIESFDGASGSSVPTFYLEPANATTHNKGRPLSSLYVNPGGSVSLNEPDSFGGEESNFEFKFAGKVQRQYTKGNQVKKVGGAKVNKQAFPIKQIRTKSIPQASTSSKIAPRVPHVLVMKKIPSKGVFEGVSSKSGPPKLKLQVKHFKMGGAWNTNLTPVAGERKAEQVVVKEEPLEEIPLQHFLVSSQSKKLVKTSESQNQCPNCFRPFNSEFLLKCHREYCRSAEEIRDMIPTRKPKCPVCTKVFGDAKALLEHIRLKHRLVRHYSCQLCDLNFKSEKNLVAHNVKNHKTPGILNATVKCDDCELKFSTTRLMEAHRGRMHPRPPKLTPIIGSRRSSRSNKGQHRYKARLDL